jgi:quercetin dioxygenase-like cupin family protein
MTTDSLLPTIVRADGAPRFGQDGFEIIGLAAPSRGCATVSAWRIAGEPGAASPVHRLTTDEAFVVLRGEVSVAVGDEILVARAGDAFSVPPAVDFQLRNAGDEPFEAVACMAAGGRAQVGEGAPFPPPWAV